jgi:hypothetical protein
MIAFTAFAFLAAFSAFALICESAPVWDEDEQKPADKPAVIGEHA